MSTTVPTTTPSTSEATLARAGADEPRRVHRRYAAARALAAMMPTRGDSWLARRERAELAALRDNRRRNAWLLARMLAKQLVVEVADGLDAGQIEVLSRDALGRVNRPRVWCQGVEQPWSLSISHSGRGALVALATDSRVSLGVDLADSETFSDGFVDLWFTPDERNWFHETQSPSIACFIWAAKEAVYKACNQGESFAPRDLEVLANGQCSYRQTPLRDCRLQSWTVDGHLAVLATVTAPRTSYSNT